MSLRDRIFKGGLKLGFGQVFSQGCSFVRSVIVARLITPADFGIAATFSITLSLIEMVSNLAAERLIVQSQNGNEERFQATIQGVQFFRGLFSGIVLFCVAEPVTRLFGVPKAAWAYQWLALIPVFRGLIHHDITRLQRHMQFGPSILVEAISIGSVTIFAYPLGIWLGDYSCMLWIILAQTALAMVLSHIFAERRYRWAFERDYVREMVHFGWPLLINGFLLFGILQGDLFVIGSADRIFGENLYSLETLGKYSVAFSMTFAPTMLITNISTPLFLPLLSTVQADKEIFIRRYDFVCQAITLLGGMLAITFIVSGEWFVRIIYGAKYAANVSGLVAWLAAMQALRIIRTGPTLAAIAKGDTRNAMYSNMARSVMLIATLYIVSIGGHVSLIAASGFAGELLALVFCLWRLQRKHGIHAIICMKLSFIAGAFMIAGPAVIAFLQEPVTMGTNIFISGVTVILFSGWILTSFSNFRNDIVMFVKGN